MHSVRYIVLVAGWTVAWTCSIVDDEREEVPPHEFTRDATPGELFSKQKPVTHWDSCQPVRQWSVAGFECAVVAVFLISYVVLLRRRRQLQRLSVG